MATVEVREFINYTPPPQHPDEILEWKERMKYFHDDIDWLLRLPAAHFWQQITKDRTFSQSYDSFWEFCPRPYDLHVLPSQCLPIHNQMKKLMLLLFLRICDDTEMENFAGSSHACVIYENFLIDVPKIIDVCSIYASAAASTKDLISRALSNIFQKQEGYWSDLDIAIETVIRTIDSVADQFALLEDVNEPTPKPLTSSESMQFSNEELTDALLFLYDTFNSLVSLLSFCGSTSSVFLAHGALQRAAMIVDKYIPRLRDQFQVVLDNTQKRCFNRTKKLCIQFCNLVLRECFFKESNTVLCEKSMCHAYLDAISSLLSETKFIIEYEKQFQFSKVLIAINEDLQKEFDHSISYIQLVLKSLMPDVEKTSDGMEQAGAMAPMAGAAAAMADDAVDSVVLQLKAMMPDENDAFLRASVVHFDGDPEKVVNHLLEDNIPPFLQDIRKSSNSLEMKRSPFETELEKKTPENQLPGRYYLKSEVSTKDIQDEIFQGKKATRNRQRSSSMLSDHDYTLLSGFDEYDDEYDDTYDSHNIGVMDADSGDELKDLTSRRSFVKPRVLQALEKQDRQSDEDDDGDDEEEGSESNEENNPPAKQDEKKQITQPHKVRPPQGRGRDYKRGDRQRHGNRERRDNATKAQDDRTPKGARGGGEYQPPPRMRGRGGHTGKKHNQKSLALKKSAKGMTGF